MANRLQWAQSPYLQQHKEQPIDWYEWGQEAFQRAEREGKLIFLSIGYSSCHWCHVMAREVFENEEVARLLNDHFISIKVDREERPDIDHYFQEVYRLLNQRPGGWPLSIFMTPQGHPFFAATYIPLQPRFNMPGFIQLLRNIIEVYQEDPNQIHQQAKEVMRFMQPSSKREQVAFDPSIAQTFVAKTKALFDPVHGGFGSKPKFPQTSTINTLLTIYRLTKNRDALEMATKTLREMAKGGLRDLVDGGFCRYSTDERWLVPHFEKMTYDNALLMESYLLAFHTTQEPLFKEIAFEIADFMVEYMSHKGLFFSASDADSQGEEGGYFTYTFDEVVAKLQADGLSSEEIQEVLQRLNITPEGNFAGKNIVRVEDLELCQSQRRGLASLRELRQERCYPFIDRKIITSWNAMMIKSLYMAARIENRYFEVAEESMDSLLKTMLVDDHLYHSTIIGEKPKIKGFLEDYAYLAIALLEGYKTTLNEEYLARANLLVNDALVEFYDQGKWYFSKGELFVEAEHTDTTYPSSAAVMVEGMLTLAALVHQRYFTFAQQTIDYYGPAIMSHLPWSGRFVTAILRTFYEDRIIKSTPANLAPCTPRIDSLIYPFILLKEEEHEELVLCDWNRCFATARECREILGAIDG
ncbi:MAG: thioredoxin domain-containing protein [Nitratiruptor sp.]|nr:thioredoxin domain-containing protein [Nitratiruptor sp.]NPA83914.1 thioredoxin domain-containing protein [Campylobacterota bacterium]